MTRLLIGNEFNEDRSAVAEAKRRKTAWWTQRLMWFARDDDILVMAVRPDDEFFDHVTALTGTRRDTLRVVVPPPGELGAGVLTADRLADPVFLAALRAAIGGRAVSALVALHPDVAVADLADELGVPEMLAGGGFLGQEGGRLVGSKAVFRAIAAGTGVPVPAGSVCHDRAAGARRIGALLDAHGTVMLKHDLRSGGRGNEILSVTPGVVPVGAQRCVVVPDRRALRDYLADRWDWLTSHDRGPVVVEQYWPDSRAVFAEFDVTEDGPVPAGDGELVSAPLAAAQIIPVPHLSPAAARALADGAERLSRALHAMGYRGMVSADAIVTPEDDVLFTEYNGRITGSTPVYKVIGECVVGADYADTRVLLDRDGWPVPSFSSAMDIVARAGLTYDRETRTGVVLVMPYNTANNTVRYCVIDETLELARKRQDLLESMSATAGI